jgi:hypothetical protein
VRGEGGEEGGGRREEGGGRVGWEKEGRGKRRREEVGD